MIFFNINKISLYNSKQKEIMNSIQLDNELICLIENANENVEQIAFEKVEMLDILNVNKMYDSYMENPFRTDAADMRAKEVSRLQKRILSDMNDLAKTLIKRARR